MANKKISELRKTAKLLEKNMAIIRQKIGSNALVAEIEELPGVLNEQADLLERLDQELAVDASYYGKTDYEHVTERIDILNFVKTGERKDIREWEG